MRLDELLQKSKPWVSILKKLQDEPRFKAWFKNSKVEENGLPKIVYHSGKGDWRLVKPFSHFGTEKAADHRYNDNGQQPLAFTVPFLLSIQKPLVIDDLTNHHISDYFKFFNEKWKNSISREELFAFRYGDPSYTKDDALRTIRKLIEKKGFDGLFYKNMYEDTGSLSFIILRPAQAMPLFKLAKLVL